METHRQSQNQSAFRGEAESRSYSAGLSSALKKKTKQIKSLLLFHSELTVRKVNVLGYQSTFSHRYIQCSPVIRHPNHAGESASSREGDQGSVTALQ